VGNAVRRNRAKRLLRALFIETLPDLGTGSYILVAKAPILEAAFAELRSGWRKALDRSRAWAPKAPER
jgi:ribonuclease P protein component